MQHSLKVSNAVSSLHSISSGVYCKNGKDLEHSFGKVCLNLLRWEKSSKPFPSIHLVKQRSQAFPYFFSFEWIFKFVSRLESFWLCVFSNLCTCMGFDISLDYSNWQWNIWKFLILLLICNPVLLGQFQLVLRICPGLLFDYQVTH